MRIIHEKVNKNVKFNELEVGDLFYNVITEAVYLKITADTGHDNAVNLNLACTSKYAPNHEVIKVNDYKFQYTI